jgi:hypothetical protein
MMIMITLMARIMMLERAMITKNHTHVTLTTNQIMMKIMSLTKPIAIIKIKVIFREEYLLSNLIKHHVTQKNLQESKIIIIISKLKKISWFCHKS